MKKQVWNCPEGTWHMTSQYDKTMCKSEHENGNEKEGKEVRIMSKYYHGITIIKLTFMSCCCSLFICNDFKRTLVSVCKLFWHSFSFPSLRLPFYITGNKSGKNKLVLYSLYCHWHVLFSFFLILFLHSISTETSLSWYFSHRNDDVEYE